MRPIAHPRPILAALALATSSCAYRPLAAAPSGTGPAEALAARLVAAVGARDMGRILAAYAPESDSRRRVEEEYQPILGLDGLRWGARVAWARCVAAECEAAVLEESTWKEHGRARANAEWRTWSLRRDAAGDWHIAGDGPRDYASAAATDLEIALRPEQGTMSGRAHLRIDLQLPGADRVLLGLNRGLEVRALAGPGGEPLAYRRTADVLLVEAPPATGGEVALTLEFEGRLFNESAEQGYSQVGIAPEGSFASWVTDWYPHLLGVGSKSRGRLAFDVPRGVTVAASGRRVESGDAGPGRSRQVFQVDAPLDFSFAAARYFQRSREVDGTTLGVYLLEGGEARAELYLDTCAKVLATLKRFYGFYPYDGYAVVEIPAAAVGTLGGSSEQGMNLFPTGQLPSDRFPLPLVAHEMGHSWWGNLVQSRSGPILSEGLAQLTAVLAVEEIEGAGAMRRFLYRGAPGYAQSAVSYFLDSAGRSGKDLPLSTVPATADAGMALHELSDVKGHFVFQMLREEMGAEPFRAGMRLAAGRYARKAMSLDDLQRALEEASGRDLGRFFGQWLRRAGAPELRLRYAVAPEGKRFAIDGVVEQVGEPYALSVELALAGSDGPPRVETLAVAGPSTPFHLRVDQRPQLVLLDPAYKVLRWTAALRNVALLREGQSLRAWGQTAAAIARLRAYLEAVPDGTEGHLELGEALEESGELGPAARALEAALALARLSPLDEPWAASAALRRGQVADLEGRRAEAKGFYARAAALVEGQGEALRAEASALQERPYQRVHPEAPPDAGQRARCAGTWAYPDGDSLEIAEVLPGTLSRTRPGTAAFLLPLGGARFKLLNQSGPIYEFGGQGPRFSELTVRFGSRVFHLVRKE